MKDSTIYRLIQFYKGSEIGEENRKFLTNDDSNI